MYNRRATPYIIRPFLAIFRVVFVEDYYLLNTSTIMGSEKED